MVMGGDFQYMNAFQNYQFMDNMIGYMNKNYGDEYEFIYSTPSIYTRAVAKNNKDLQFPTKYDDLLPLFSDPGNAWTGFFTSRANYKDYERKTSRLSHAAQQLYAEELVREDNAQMVKESLMANYEMLNSIGINQHHDAITGTGD